MYLMFVLVAGTMNIAAALLAWFVLRPMRGRLIGRSLEVPRTVLPESAH
jgi:hypothetical protein